MEQRLSQTQHTLTTLVDCASPSVTDSTGSERLPNPITLPMREALPGSRCLFAPTFPGQTSRAPGTTLTHHHFSSLCFLVALLCTLTAPRTTPVYLQLIIWGTSPKIENHSSSFSGVNLCLCSWYKLNLVTLYNCFNFAFTIPKALLLIGNCLFNLVFSKHCYCFSPLKRKKEKHFRKESVITFLVHPQIGIPCRSL